MDSGEVAWLLIMGVLILIFELFSPSRSGPPRRAHQPPRITSKGTGARYGLTAVEAAVLLGRPMDTVLTMILFGVLKKGAARILSLKPLELEVTDPLPHGLYGYEVDFLKAFQEDKAHLSDNLKENMVTLIKAVSDKMRGFSRTETVYYYQRLVEEAWREVQAAATPEVKSQKFDEKMDWALLDSEFAGRIALVLGASPLPVPGWWERYTPLIQSATGQGELSTVATGPHWPAGALPELPGADFAASIANGIQDFSAAAIGDIQHFASKIADQTGLSITESSGGQDGGHDSGWDSGRDSWWASSHDGGHDGGHDSGWDSDHDSGSDGGFDGGADIDFDLD